MEEEEQHRKGGGAQAPGPQSHRERRVAEKKSCFMACMRRENSNAELSSQ